MIFCICRGLSWEDCRSLGLEGLKDGQVCGDCVREYNNEEQRTNSKDTREPRDRGVRGGL